METTPLNRVIDTFRALRLRYVLVVRNGALVGITTKVRVGGGARGREGEWGARAGRLDSVGGVFIRVDWYCDGEESVAGAAMAGGVMLACT